MTTERTPTTRLMASAHTAAGILDFHTAELNECHRLLDTIGISQSGFEEQLSISQRVAQTVGLVNTLRSHVTARMVIKHIQGLNTNDASNAAG